MVTDLGRVTAHRWWATGQPPVEALCMVITGTRLTAVVYLQTYYLVHHLPSRKLLQFGGKVYCYDGMLHSGIQIHLPISR